MSSFLFGIAGERDELVKVVADLEAWLKELESRLEEFEHRAAKEREASKELAMYKKKAVEQHEKDFQKAVRQVGFFAKDLTWVFLTLSRM